MSQKRNIQIIWGDICRRDGSFFYDSPCLPQFWHCPAIPACQPKTYTRVLITPIFHQKDHFLSYIERKKLILHEQNLSMSLLTLAKHPAAAPEPGKRGTHATAAPGSGACDSSGISSKSSSDPQGYDLPSRPPPPGCCRPGEASPSPIPSGAEHLSHRWYDGGSTRYQKSGEKVSALTSPIWSGGFLGACLSILIKISSRQPGFWPCV